MIIRKFAQADLPRVIALWNQAAVAGEVLYKQLNSEYFASKFLSDPNYNPDYSLVADCDGRVIGFVNAICPDARPNARSADVSLKGIAFLSMLLVDKSYRMQSVGSKLLAALETRLCAAGKREIDCDERNPVELDWLVPGRNGHEHGYMPGIDESCQGYLFLTHRGYKTLKHQLAMHISISDYAPSPELDALCDGLRSDGIYIGRYDRPLNYDALCDALVDPYWRKSITDSLYTSDPKPVFVAAVDDAMIGFAGPADKRPNGRARFAGVCVDPQYRGRGIGTALFNLMMKEFVTSGALFSTLFTDADNYARRIFEKAGFKSVRTFVSLRKGL